MTPRDKMELMGLLEELLAQYLKLTGGILSNNLHISGKTNDYPQLLAGYRNSDSGAKFTYSEGSKYLNIFCCSEGNSVALDINPNKDLASKFQVIVDNANWYDIFGEHNKPSGGYTGNGDATARTIRAGALGKIAYIYEGNTSTFVLVTPVGGIKKTASGIVQLSYANVHVERGAIIVASTDAALNQSGLWYEYGFL